MRIYGFALLPVLAFSGNSLADGFPTEETVRFVLNCMAGLGAQTDENLYTCICRHDVIAKSMSYEEYEGAMTFERNQEMPGDRGGFVRDNKLAKEDDKKLQKARVEADAQCPVVKHVKRPPVTKQN